MTKPVPVTSLWLAQIHLLHGTQYLKHKINKMTAVVARLMFSCSDCAPRAPRSWWYVLGRAAIFHRANYFCLLSARSRSRLIGGLNVCHFRSTILWWNYFVHNFRLVRALAAPLTCWAQSGSSRGRGWGCRPSSARGISARSGRRRLTRSVDTTGPSSWP